MSSSTADVSVPAQEAAVPSVERERNRVLRRADWRYLLPDPSPHRALCIGGPELRASCAAVAKRIDSAPQPGVSYDLVVAEDPDDATLRLLARSVRPDGACYVEWRAVGPGGMRRLRRRLERAGFRHPRCYQPWPSLPHPRAWVPTEGVAAAHYWRSAIHSGGRRRDQLRDAAGWALAQLGARPRVGIVALGSAATAANADPFLMRVARGHDASLTLDREGDAPCAQRLLLLTSGARSVGKVVALVFDAADRPAIAVKTTRVPESAAGLLREGELLDAVHALRPGGMAGVPRVLFRAEMRGEPVIGETALTGTPLSTLLSRRRYPALAERVTAWLSALAEPAARAPWTPTWDRMIAPALDRFAVEFAPVIDASQLRRTHEILRTLGSLPTVCEQRDFSPWNVFDGPRGIVVLDWESGEARGLPAMDLVYFLTHAAYYLEGAWRTGRFEAAYRAAWSRETAIGRVNHQCARAYLEQLGVSGEMLGPLRLLAWVLHAHSEYIHFHADAVGPPPADALRRSTFLRLYNAELQENASC